MHVPRFSRQLHKAFIMKPILFSFICFIYGSRASDVYSSQQFFALGDVNCTRSPIKVGSLRWIPPRALRQAVQSSFQVLMPTIQIEFALLLQEQVMLRYDLDTSTLKRC